jgi:hypothetical protein
MKNLIFEAETQKVFTTFFLKTSLQAADFSADSG